MCRCGHFGIGCLDAGKDVCCGTKDEKEGKNRKLLNLRDLNRNEKKMLFDEKKKKPMIKIKRKILFE